MRGGIAGVLAAISLLGVSCSKPAEEPPVKTGPPPAVFRVRFETNKGPFVVEVHRDWAPLAVDRFYELVQQKYFDDNRFFRVVPGFVAQFGLSGFPKASQYWSMVPIQDEPRKEHNDRGSLSFAQAGANSRTSQVFINITDNSSNLDSQGFVPFGRVVQGMETVEDIYSGYGDKPDYSRILREGNAYLNDEFNGLDFIKTARVQ
jgi:peptidyl-prolyl cis-trans isomerase A (cyclophilin A)